MQVDHIISQRNFWGDVKNKYGVPDFLSHLTENDVNHIDNLMPSCRSCNGYKSAMTLERFRKEISLQLERLNLRCTNYKIAKRFGMIQENNNPIIFYFETL